MNLHTCVGLQETFFSRHIMLSLKMLACLRYLISPLKSVYQTISFQSDSFWIVVMGGCGGDIFSCLCVLSIKKYACPKSDQVYSYCWKRRSFLLWGWWKRRLRGDTSEDHSAWLAQGHHKKLAPAVLEQDLSLQSGTDRQLSRRISWTSYGPEDTFHLLLLRKWLSEN